MFIYGIAQDELGIKRHLAIFVSAVAVGWAIRPVCLRADDFWTSSLGRHSDWINRAVCRIHVCIVID